MLSDSDTIALSSAVISASALGLAVWQGLLQRRHARLSVRPYFVMIRDWRDESRGLTLLNTGLGPGAFKHMTLTFDGKRYDVNVQNGQHGLREELRTRTTTALKAHVNGPGVGHFLSVGWRQPIVEFLDPTLDQTAAAVIAGFIRDVKIEATYESLYGDSYDY